jgi:hypothetical protein
MSNYLVLKKVHSMLARNVSKFYYLVDNPQYWQKLQQPSDNTYTHTDTPFTLQLNFLCQFYL